jgi:hypothetical protein
LTCDKGASLPRLCLFSGEPSDERVSRSLSWAPQWFVFVAVMSPLLAGLLYLVIRKTGRLEYSLSPLAKSRVRSALWLSLGGGIGCFVLAGVAGAADQPALALLLIALALIAIVVGSLRSRLFQVTKIDKVQISIKLRADAANAFSRYLAGVPAAR